MFGSQEVSPAVYYPPTTLPQLLAFQTGVYLSQGQLSSNSREQNSYIEQLEKQVQALTQEVHSLRSQIENADSKHENTPKKHVSYVLVRSQDGRTSKEFTKHLKCPHDKCRKRYSSKIALRTHIRRQHPTLSDA